MKPEDLIFPKQPGLDASDVVARLHHAAESRNPREIESAVTAAYQVGLRHDFVPALLEILDLPDHISHEDIVGALQALKDPRAIQSLHRTALKRYAYLDYDEFFGLARKCTWALADIGTPEALAKLELLASCENSTIAGYARKRIEHWQEEKHRK